MAERTLVIVKPDAFAKGLTGEILQRLLRTGLVLRQIRVSEGDQNAVHNHYPTDDEWLRTVGNKSIEDYRSQGLSVQDALGTEDPLEIGREIRRWLTEYLASGPLVPFVLEGNRAIESTRKIIGSTLPVLAAPGTIRGDFSTDSPDLANAEKRPVQNLVHASGDREEAEREIQLWFPAKP